MISYKSHTKNGFTLIELVTAIAIIFILTAIAIPVITNVFSSSNSRSDEASAKSIEEALSNIYKATLSGEKKGHHYLYDFKKLSNTTMQAFFKDILANGNGSDYTNSGSDDEYQNIGNSYGSVKISDDVENAPAFISGISCFLGKNNLPFLCIKDAQGMDRCKVFYCVSVSNDESVLTCKDTDGNVYTIFNPSGTELAAVRYNENNSIGDSIILTYLLRYDKLGNYFDFENMEQN